MRKNKVFRSLFVLAVVVTLLCGFSTVAYAGGGEDIPTDDSGVVTEPQPLTPEGNMTLVDDIEGDAAGDKQFIVVQSRGGNYFYIVIDKAAQGENTVHFLNQVDEKDLLSIIEEEQAEEAPAVCDCTDKCEPGAIKTSCPVCATDRKGCTGKEAEPQQPAEPEKGNSGMGGLVVFLVVALLGGGGALYYFKFMKPKQSVKGGTDLDDLDFEDYDEDEPEADEGDAAADEAEDAEL